MSANAANTSVHATRVAHALLTLLKKPFAGHGPAPRGMYVVDLQSWGRAVPCRSAFHKAFFSNVTLACRVATYGDARQ
jgi:hypothetical protein